MEMIAAHSNDLMLEILYRLPVKSVLRFKCVSKHWLSLISNPSFPLNHSFHQPPPDSSISSFFIQPSLSMQLDFTPIDKTNSGVPDPSLSFLESDFLITQSCNGLLLCRYNRYGKDIAFCVCNPTTMENILLPKLPTIMSKQCISTIAFDPSKSPHYKVICVSDPRQKRIHVSIYSSQTGSWRPSAEAFHEPCLSLREKGVLWNGALHWTSLCESSLSFHVEREFLRTINLPPELSRSNRVCEYFGESNGHLYLIESYGSGMTEIYIYEMECDYSQWSFRYHVNLDIVFKTYPEKLPLLAGLFYPRINTSWEFTQLHLLQGGGEEVLWIYIPGKIISYQIADGNFDKYYDFEHQSLEWPQFHAYSNTLSSIRSLSS